VLFIDDHLLRDVLAGDRELGALGAGGLATTGRWLFRLSASFADPTVSGKLSAPVAGLPEALRARFRADLVALPAGITLLSVRDLAWPMAVLQVHHRAAGRPLSAAMVEALVARTTSTPVSPSPGQTSAHTYGRPHAPTRSPFTRSDIALVPAIGGILAPSG
jgi:hypothetical protein